jgi:hypothetical protein
MNHLIFFFLSPITILAAGLDFTSTLQEIDAPIDSKSVVAEFPFTNHSEKTITIARHDSPCSCLGVEIDKGKLSYAPGESGMVRTTFSIGNFSGTVDKSIAIWLDDERATKPVHTLTVRVKIPVLITLEPKTVAFKVGDKTAAKVIDIQMQGEKPTHVIKIVSSSAAFRHELITVKEGKHYRLQIEPINSGKRELGVFRIETDITSTRQRVQQAFAVIR